MTAIAAGFPLVTTWSTCVGKIEHCLECFLRRGEFCIVSCESANNRLIAGPCSSRRQTKWTHAMNKQLYLVLRWRVIKEPKNLEVTSVDKDISTEAVSEMPLSYDCCTFIYSGNRVENCCWLNSLPASKARIIGLGLMISLKYANQSAGLCYLCKL